MLAYCPWYGNATESGTDVDLFVTIGGTGFFTEGGGPPHSDIYSSSTSFAMLNLGSLNESSSLELTD